MIAWLICFLWRHDFDCCRIVYKDIYGYICRSGHYLNKSILIWCKRCHKYVRVV